MGFTEEALRAAVAEYDDDKSQLLARRDVRLRAFHANGWRPVDIQRITGYSRETIRHVLNPEIREAANASRRKAPRVGAARPSADTNAYGDRKPYIVAGELGDLRGPTGGTVTLPHHLDWSGGATYDLDRPARLSSMYKAVLNEASTTQDLRDWLDERTLIETMAHSLAPHPTARAVGDQVPRTRHSPPGSGIAVDAFHEKLARTGLAAAQRYGFALAGGYAVQAAGLLVRPTEDIDLFTAWERRADFAAAVSAVIDAYVAEGLSVDYERRHDTFVRLQVSDGERTSKVELAVDSRANEPIHMTVGLVLHPDDAVANKMGALYSRALARDFIDVDAAVQSGRYDRETLLRLAERAEIGFDRRVFAEALGQIENLDRDDFAEYGILGASLDGLRDRFAAWRQDLHGNC